MSKFNSCSFLLVLALFTATSCSDEDMNNYTYYESAWCLVQGKGNQISFLTDEKVILKPSESLDSTLYKAGDRYRVLFITLGGQGANTMASSSKLIKIAGEPQPVLVDDIIQHENFIGVVNDPVWLSSDPFFGGGFLNFDFQFRASRNGIKHGIYLLQDSLVNRTLYLRFGHHANGDVTGSLESALASFPTASLMHTSVADSLVVVLQGDIRIQSYRMSLRDTLR